MCKLTEVVDRCNVILQYCNKLSTMDNLTDTTPKTSFVFRPNIWFSNIIISGILGVISLYLVTALIFYEFKQKTSKKQRFRQMSMERKFAVLSKYACIIIGITSLIRHCSGFARMLFEYKAVFTNHPQGQHHLRDYTSTCKTFSILANFTITFGSGLVFSFLWFKQRVFYIHPCLKKLNNKIVQGISNGVMVIWFLYYVSLYFCYFILVHYHFNKQGGCLVTESSHDAYFFLIISWTSISILMQIVLLGLFIYPMLKRTLWQSDQNHERSNGLMQRVKKATLLASICLATDLLSILATQFLFVKNANAVIFPFSINLVINHLVTIVCFDHWKNLLWPWYHKPSNDSHQSRAKSDGISSPSTMSTRDAGNRSSVDAVLE